MVFDAKPASMLLRWRTNGGNFDFFEIWRYVASNNTDKEWVKIGYTTPNQKDGSDFNYYEDTTPLPGVPYYYALVPVYQGNYGKIYYSNKFMIEAGGANLRLVSFEYYHGLISRQTSFPSVVVRNDGDTDIQRYTVGVLAKSWADGTLHQVGTGTWTGSLAAGEQQEYDITDIDISDFFANGTVFSWGLWIDYDEEIDEVYESDNMIWSNDGWYLSSNTGMTTAAATGKEDRSMQLGSSRPFVNSVDIANPALRMLTEGTKADTGRGNGKGKHTCTYRGAGDDQSTSENF
jgi:hypothetical protein